jgi:hypothetical protein
MQNELIVRERPNTSREETYSITEEEGGRRLRSTLHGGSRGEEVVILNALIRVYVREMVTESIKRQEEGFRRVDAGILDLQKRIESGQQPDMVDTYSRGIDNLRFVGIPACRDEFARLKPIKVIKWAK